MPIAVACECGHDFEVREKYQGRKFKCPSCSQPVQAGEVTPKSPARAQKSAMNSDLIALACQCGKRIAAKREWAGKRTKCPSCGQVIQIPGGSKTTPRPQKPKSDLDELLDEVGVSRATHRCPSCKGDLKEGDVICIRCGYDLERGKPLRTKTYQSSARQLDKHAPAKEKKANPIVRIVALVLLVVVIAVVAVIVPKFLG